MMSTLGMLAGSLRDRMGEINNKLASLGARDVNSAPQNDYYLKYLINNTQHPGKILSALLMIFYVVATAIQLKKLLLFNFVRVVKLAVHNKLPANTPQNVKQQHVVFGGSHSFKEK